jgi:DNA-binding beta-propeller fold protein YncE
MRLVAVAVAALALASAATAGGDFVDLASAGSTLWFVGAFGIREVDASSGRTLSAPEPHRAAYPTSVAVSGGAVWVASVANGFVDGELTRIDLRTRRDRVVVRVPDGSVQYAAAGAGGVYAFVGLRSGDRIVRFDTTGRRTGTWLVADGGRMAADASGCWVSATKRLVHIDPAGRLHAIPGVGFGDVATGERSVWVATLDTIVRVDERTGAKQILHTGPLRLGGFQHDLVVAGGSLWTLAALHPSLQRRDLRTGRVTGSVPLPGIPDAVVPTPDGIWVAVAPSHQILRFDPRSLRRTLATTIR